MKRKELFVVVAVKEKIMPSRRYYLLMIIKLSI
jgi:hypothetical protein